MRRSILPTLALLALAACSFGSSGNAEAGDFGVAASGSGTSRTFAVAGFDTIELRGSDDVDVRVGSGFSVRAQGPSDVLDRLQIARRGSALRIGRKSGGFTWSDGDALKVMVTMPRIAGAKVAGSGDITIDRVEGSRFDSSTTGSGTLAIRAMQIDEAALSVAGSARVTVAGAAKRLVVRIAGSGDVDARAMRIDTAKVSVAGSGSIRANVSGQADVDLAGSGNVDLGTTARCKVRSVGSGTVRCGAR
jgi:hypothetical protein